MSTRPEQLMTHSLSAHPQGRALSEIMAAALDAVDPAVAVGRNLQRDGRAIVVAGTRYELGATGRVIVVGGGKAGAPMAQAAYAALGDSIAAGLVVVKAGHAGEELDLGPIGLREASHPVPDQRGVDASAQLMALLRDLTEHDLVLVLVSGGASALLTLPSAGLGLADLQALTNALLRCGAPIGHINTLRKHCSQVGGGQLAARAAPASVAALVISDVVGSPLDVIASGPTVPDPTTFADAWALIQGYELEPELPPVLVAHIKAGVAGERPETPKAHDPLWERVRSVVVASNVSAAEAAVAAARERGLNTLLLTTFLEGEARAAGTFAAALARELALRDAPLVRPALLVLGGETTVTLRGDGRGGRNQELALGAVAALSDVPGALVVALATDGGDGPTDAAGATVAGDTLRRALALGLDPALALSRNDAYPFFAALDDLLRPGPTLTNVNDLLLIAVG